MPPIRKDYRAIAWGLLGIIILVHSSPQGYASAASGSQQSSCGISLSLQPPIVYYSSFPTTGNAFGEVVTTSYPPQLENATFLIQYYNGANWITLSSFQGISQQFNLVNIVVYSYWAHYGPNQLKVVANQCVSNVATLMVQQNNQGITQDIAIWSIVALSSALLIVLSRVLPFKLFLVVAAAVYLGIAPFTGQRYDVYFLYSSGIRLLDKVSPFFPGSPPIYPFSLKWAYPPAYVPYSALSYLIYSAFTGMAIPSNASLTYPAFYTATYEVWEAFVPPSLPALVFLLKIPMIVSAFIIFRILSKSIGQKTALTFWLANPFVIFVTSAWGQIDPIATVFAVGSIYFAKKERFGLAYLLAGIGAAFKVWPALIIPIVFVERLRRVGFGASMKELTWLLPPLLLSLGLYGAYGNLVQSLFVFAYARGVPTYAGEFTVNGLTWQQILVGIHAPPIPLLLFIGGPALILILVLAYKKQGPIESYLLVALLVVFLSYNYVNPQYFYWLIPFFLLLGKKFQGALYSALPLVYTALSYNILYFVSPVLVYDVYEGPLAIVEQIKTLLFYNSSLYLIGVFGVASSVIYLLSASELLGLRKLVSRLLQRK